MHVLILPQHITLTSRIQSKELKVGKPVEAQCGVPVAWIQSKELKA